MCNLPIVSDDYTLRVEVEPRLLTRSRERSDARRANGEATPRKGRRESEATPFGSRFMVADVLGEDHEDDVLSDIGGVVADAFEVA
jgi:hypothetical protein